MFLKTLATSYAAVNNFNSAIKTTGNALLLAQSMNDPALIADLPARLQRYKLNIPD